MQKSIGLDNLLSDNEFLRRESELRSSTIAKQDIFGDVNAQRHFNEGFVRRHYMLQSSRLFLAKCCSQFRKKPLSPYEATESAIHLNAYYLNLCGALDNLAWVLQHEWQLLPSVTEDKNRNKCGLFKEDFLGSLNSRNLELMNLFGQYKNWAKRLTDFRDPAAHRIPIYVPPSVITTQEQIDKFSSVLDQSNISSSFEIGDKPISEIYQEAQAVGNFEPLMVLSSTQGLLIYSIDRQIRSDHDIYLTIAKAIVDTV